MQRISILVGALVAAFAIAGCSGTPETTLSPTGVDADASALNPDGSSLKANPPVTISPRDTTVDTLRPTLQFTAAVGRFVTTSFSHEIEVVNANGTVVYSRILAESSGATSHALESDLTYADNFWWRGRARLGNEVGPWSDWLQFRTLDRISPATPTGPSGTLPFPVPAACGSVDPSNGFGCAAAVAALSAEWAACAGGRGVNCHRFTRQVVYALSQSDPNWRMIMAAPGGHACNCSGCGPSDGTMFREDTTVYGGNRVFDMIVGAGGPSPSLTWSPVPGPRPGDIPSSAPLCP
jgi:hypothetical protein